MLKRKVLKEEIREKEEEREILDFIQEKKTPSLPTPTSPPSSPWPPSQTTKLSPTPTHPPTRRTTGRRKHTYREGVVVLVVENIVGILDTTMDRTLGICERRETAKQKQSASRGMDTSTESPCRPQHQSSQLGLSGQQVQGEGRGGR